MGYTGKLILVLISAIVLSHYGTAQWVRNPEEFSGVSVMALASNGATLYAGTPGAVYRSADNGMTWEMLPGSPTKVCAFAFNGSYIFAGSQEAAIGAMRSSDKGISWMPINKGCQKDVSSLALCDTVLLRGNAGFTGSPNLYRSTDHGNSWVSGAGPQFPVYAIGQRGRELYAGTRWTGVCRSLDSGLTWSSPNWFCGLPGNPVGLENVQAFATMDTTIFAAVSYLGIFRSFDGISWEAASSGLGNGWVTALAVSGNNLFAGTAGGGIFLSANMGITWTPMNAGLEDLNVQTIAVQGDLLLVGTRTGLWIRPLLEMVQSQDLYEVFPLHTGWSGRFSYVYRCNWNNASKQTHGTWIDSSIVQYQLLDPPTVVDGSRTWSVRESDHMYHWEQTYSSAGVIDEKEWWKDSSSVFVLKEHLTGLHEIEVKSKVWNFPRTGIQGLHRLYRYSYDSLYALGVPRAVERCFFDTQRGMFARDYHDTRLGNPPADSIITIRMLGEPTVQGVEQSGSRLAGFELLNNYPNPFNPVTRINYTVGGTEGPGTGGGRAGEGVVRLIVYDLLGREVAVLVNEKKAPGTYETIFDATGLSSGVYFYRLSAGDFVATRRLLLLK